MGRSRGGLTTKIHAVVDANGNPIALKLSEGQAHDGRADGLPDTIGKGQVRLADRGYDSDALREAVTSRGAWANIKPMPNCALERPLVRQPGESNGLADGQGVFQQPVR